MEWFALLGVVILGLLLAAIISEMGPQQYNPMSPDEEYKWLKIFNLTEDEIQEIIDI